MSKMRGHLWFVGSYLDNQKNYAENMKKIMGALWGLPAK